MQQWQTVWALGFGPVKLIRIERSNCPGRITGEAYGFHGFIQEKVGTQ
jgi:hypothetical protein